MNVQEMRAKAAEIRANKEKLVCPTQHDEWIVTLLEFITELCDRLEKR